jgi:hypothetical protein
MSVSKHVVNFYLMQGPNENVPLSKEQGTWKGKIGLQKEYFIQKTEITPKRLEIAIHNVNKSSLKIKFYIYI